MLIDWEQEYGPKRIRISRDGSLNKKLYGWAVVDLTSFAQVKAVLSLTSLIQAAVTPKVTRR